MKVNLDDIKVSKKRIRRDLGDLNPLMNSMSKYGLLQPIVVSDDLTLIAGYRRYFSAKKLGWTQIDANVVSFDSKLAYLEIEIEENEARKNFDFEELAIAKAKLAKLRKPSFLKKLLNFLKKVIFCK